MFQVAVYENYQDGELIFEDGSHGDWIYIVEEGEVEISKKIGERKIVIAVMKPGELFGELSYIGKMARTANAIAIGPTVAVYWIEIISIESSTRCRPIFSSCSRRWP